MDCGQKNVQLVWRCHHLLSGFQRPLAPSVASVSSAANDKGDDEMILGAVHRSPGICLTAEENSRKPQLGGRLMKGDVRPVIASNGVPFLQMSSVGSHSTSGREKEGKKERAGRWSYVWMVTNFINCTSIVGRLGWEQTMSHVGPSSIALKIWMISMKSSLRCYEYVNKTFWNICAGLILSINGQGLVSPPWTPSFPIFLPSPSLMWCANLPTSFGGKGPHLRLLLAEAFMP